MKPEHIREIKRILCTMKCPLDFECTKVGRQDICRARDIGLDHALECREEDSPECGFAVMTDSSVVLCKCPLRLYLSKIVGM
jgi:hypothetical protein